MRMWIQYSMIRWKLFGSINIENTNSCIWCIVLYRPRLLHHSPIGNDNRETEQCSDNKERNKLWPERHILFLYFLYVYISSSFVYSKQNPFPFSFYHSTYHWVHQYYATIPLALHEAFLNTLQWLLLFGQWAVVSSTDIGAALSRSNSIRRCPNTLLS